MADTNQRPIVQFPLREFIDCTANVLQTSIDSGSDSPSFSPRSLLNVLKEIQKIVSVDHMINVPYFSTGHVVRRLFEILRQMGFESEDVQFDNVGLPYNEPFAARALGIVFMEILNLIKNEYLGDGTESAENLGLLYAMDRTNQTSRITYVIINGRQKQKCRVCRKSYELKNYGAHLGTKTHIINMIVFIFPNYNVRS